MDTQPNQVWQKCLEVIRQSVNAQSFKTWFDPIQPVKLDGSVLTILVPNKFFYEFLEEHYVRNLQAAIIQVIGPQAQLNYRIPRKKEGVPSLEDTVCSACSTNS